MASHKRAQNFAGNTFVKQKVIWKFINVRRGKPQRSFHIHQLDNHDQGKKTKEKNMEETQRFLSSKHHDEMQLQSSSAHQEDPSMG